MFESFLFVSVTIPSIKYETPLESMVLPGVLPVLGAMEQEVFKKWGGFWISMSIHHYSPYPTLIRIVDYYINQ